MPGKVEQREGEQAGTDSNREGPHDRPVVGWQEPKGTNHNQREEANETGAGEGVATASRATRDFSPLHCGLIEVHPMPTIGTLRVLLVHHRTLARRLGPDS
jgi:hypothetical protein